jgi:hypothetical protein
MRREAERQLTDSDEVGEVFQRASVEELNQLRRFCKKLEEGTTDAVFNFEGNISTSTTTAPLTFGTNPFERGFGTTTTTTGNQPFGSTTTGTGFGFGNTGTTTLCNFLETSQITG